MRTRAGAEPRQPEALDELLRPMRGGRGRREARDDPPRQLAAAEQQVHGQRHIGQRDHVRAPRRWRSDGGRRSRSARVREDVGEQAQYDDERVGGDAREPGWSRESTQHARQQVRQILRQKARPEVQGRGAVQPDGRRRRPRTRPSPGPRGPRSCRPARRPTRRSRAWGAHCALTTARPSGAAITVSAPFSTISAPLSRAPRVERASACLRTRRTGGRTPLRAA